MKLSFARLLAILAASLALGSAHAQADDFPSRPIRLLVPYAAGGGIDMIARSVAAPLGAQLKTPVITENKPGVNGVLATQEAVRASPDGYTLVLGVPASIAINPSIYRLSFDTVKDLRPVAQLAVAHFVIATATDSGIESLPDLIAKAKAAPGKYSFASYGNGSASHLAGQMLNTLAGIQTTHVPYKGSAAALPDVLSGRVSFMFDVVANVQPHVKAGKLRVLASAGEAAVPQFPNAPTARSVVPGLSLEGWVGLFAPAGTPDAIIRRLNAETAVALRTPELRARLLEAGFEPSSGSPEQLADTVRKDIEIYAKAAREARLRNE
jgi:tripartite-type tricarboxylate transporter receptor subunit TctC